MITYILNSFLCLIFYEKSTKFKSYFFLSYSSGVYVGKSRKLDFYQEMKKKHVITIRHSMLQCQTENISFRKKSKANMCLLQWLKRSSIKDDSASFHVRIYQVRTSFRQIKMYFLEIPPLNICWFNCKPSLWNTMAHVVYMVLLKFIP